LAGPAAKHCRRASETYFLAQRAARALKQPAAAKTKIPAPGGDFLKLQGEYALGQTAA
jgi:hypothetical protein